MPPLTYIHAFEAARTTTGGGALSGSENCPPHATGGKGLKTDENGARVAGGRKARFCPTEGQGRAFSCVCRWRVPADAMRQQITISIHK